MIAVFGFEHLEVGSFQLFEGGADQKPRRPGLIHDEEMRMGRALPLVYPYSLTHMGLDHAMAIRSRTRPACFILT